MAGVEGTGGYSRGHGVSNTPMTKQNSSSSPTIPPGGSIAHTYRKAKAIADRFGVCPKTIFRLADAGKITRHKINARLCLFDETEVAAFIESSRVG